MAELLQVLMDPAVPFFRYALITGLLASVAFGTIGSYVVVRRISYIAGAIAHCALGGIGAGLYLQEAMGISWFTPLLGAMLVSLLSAVLLALVSLYAGEREDSVIGALWAVGMAAGLLFIARTPGYLDPMSYLFGNILLLSETDILLVLILDLLIVGVVTLCYHRFLAICFDEEFARLRGLKTHWYYLLLLCLTALTIILLIRVVGIVMVIALLTLPAAIAGCFVRSLLQMICLATLLCMLFISSGLAVSYTLDLPSGPTIILLAGTLYLLILGTFKLRK